MAFKRVLAICVLFKLGVSAGPVMLGGVSRVVDVSEDSMETAELKDMLNSTIKAQFISKTSDKEPEQFQLLSYTSQIVAGKNYFVKVKTSDSSCAHLRIFKPLPGAGDVRLIAMQLGKSFSDPIGYFDDVEVSTTTEAPRPVVRPGGTGQVINATDPGNSKAIMDEVSELKATLASPQILGQVSARLGGRNVTTLELVSYSKQVVAGMNYFMKVKIEDWEHAHLAIFKPLPYTRLPMQLKGIQTNKTASDPVSYFYDESFRVTEPTTSTDKPTSPIAVVPEVNSNSGMLMAGGLSGVVSLVDSKGYQIDVDEINELRNATASIKALFLAKTNTISNNFEIVSYSRQVVAGTNFFLKVKLDNDRYSHLRIFRPLPFGPTPMKLELTAIQLEKSLTDPIVYFS